jgi:uncharacterized membrane protein YccC
MRPSYGLTKSDRKIVSSAHSLVRAVGIVLLTQNVVVYAVLAFVSLVFAFALIQQNYKFAAALITISIIFVYSLINPDAFEVIQYRVIDTIIGALSLSLPIIYCPSWG